MKRLTLTLGLLALAAALAACSGASANPATPRRAGRQPVRRRGLRGRQGREVHDPGRQRPGRQAVHHRLRQPGRRPAQRRDLELVRGQVFKGEIVTSQKVDYQVPALAAGSYSFLCEVHPDMKGTITVQ